MQTRARAAARLRLSLRIFESLRAGPQGRIPLLRAVLELRSDMSKPYPRRIPHLRAVLELRSDVSKPYPRRRESESYRQDTEHMQVDTAHLQYDTHSTCKYDTHSHVQQFVRSPLNRCSIWGACWMSHVSPVVPGECVTVSPILGAGLHSRQHKREPERT